MSDRIAKLIIGGLFLAGWFVFAFAPDSDPRPSDLGPATFDHSELDVFPIRGTVLSGGDRWARPDDLAAIGPYLVVADGMATPRITILRAATGNVIDATGGGGEGPGEFRRPRSVDADPGRRAAWIFDARLQRLTRVELDAEGHPRGDADQAHIVNLSASSVVLHPLPVEGGFVATGFFPEGRLGRFDTTGRQIAAGGPVPAGDAPPSVLQHAWQARIAARPGPGELVVLGHRHAGELAVHRTDGTLVRRVPGPFPFSPRYRVSRGSRGPVMGSGEDMRLGYVDVAATRDRIFALFSGRLRAGFPDGGAPYARHVHVFDWSGELHRVLELDAEVHRIAVEDPAPAGGVPPGRETGRPGGTVLYALRHLPTPAVLRFEVPPERTGS